MLKVSFRSKAGERSGSQQAPSPGLVCGHCGLLVVDRQVTVCPRCGSSLLQLTGCTGSCFTCRKSCAFTKRS